MRHVLAFVHPQDEVGVKSDVFSKPFYFSSDLKQTQLDMNFNNFFVTDLNRNIYITESMLEKIEWSRYYSRRREIFCSRHLNWAIF